jgi:hypothetical protein
MPGLGRSGQARLRTESPRTGRPCRHDPSIEHRTTGPSVIFETGTDGHRRAQSMGCRAGWQPGTRFAAAATPGGAARTPARCPLQVPCGAGAAGRIDLCLEPGIQVRVTRHHEQQPFGGNLSTACRISQDRPPPWSTRITTPAAPSMKRSTAPCQLESSTYSRLAPSCGRGSPGGPRRGDDDVGAAAVCELADLVHRVDVPGVDRRVGRDEAGGERQPLRRQEHRGGAPGGPSRTCGPALVH